MRHSISHFSYKCKMWFLRSSLLSAFIAMVEYCWIYWLKFVCTCLSVLVPILMPLDVVMCVFIMSELFYAVDWMLVHILAALFCLLPAFFAKNDFTLTQ